MNLTTGNLQSEFIYPMPKAFEDWWISCQKAAILFGQGLQDGTVSGGGSLAIPSGQTSIAITYHGATNNIQTITYQPSGTIVTLQYAAGGASDDDLLTSVSIA